MELTLILTDKEAQVLLNMIDVAVKTAGLDAAEAGLFFQKKIKDAAEAAGAKTETPPAKA